MQRKCGRFWIPLHASALSAEKKSKVFNRIGRKKNGWQAALLASQMNSVPFFTRAKVTPKIPVRVELVEPTNYEVYVIFRGLALLLTVLR